MDTAILLLSQTCLLITTMACLIGLISDYYHDNLGECLGMTCLGIWAGASAALLQGPGPGALLLHLGLASYAIGVAWHKVGNAMAGVPPTCPLVERRVLRPGK